MEEIGALQDHIRSIAHAQYALLRPQEGKMKLAKKLEKARKNCETFQPSYHAKTVYRKNSNAVSHTITIIITHASTFGIVFVVRKVYVCFAFIY